MTIQSSIGRPEPSNPRTEHLKDALEAIFRTAIIVACVVLICALVLALAMWGTYVALGVIFVGAVCIGLFVLNLDAVRQRGRYFLK